MKQPDYIHSIYDNLGKTVDRYTVFTPQLERNKLRECLCLDNRPEHPQGFSQFSAGEPGPHLGEEISFATLPNHVQRHIIRRLEP
jgi:hypothetical protein